MGNTILAPPLFVVYSQTKNNTAKPKQNLHKICNMKVIFNY